MVETAKVAYVFPGQGSQWVGMGRDLYANFDSARAVFDMADKTVGFPLSRLCFDGPEDELRQTINAQPAILTVSLACLSAARDMSRDKRLPPADFVAGHSLGEYTALAAAGVLDFADAVYLARERGRLMHEAASKQPGGMVAIIGLEETPLADVCQRTNTRIANINCPGQLIISGTNENITRAVALVKEMGTYRAIPLQVSGAFHSAMMEPAVEGMAAAIAKLSFGEPLIPIIANTTAQPLATAEAIKEELLRQLCSSIQWQRSVEYMINNGVSTLIEIGPGKVLTGLIKRIDKNVKTLNLSDAQTIREYLSTE